MWWQWANEGKHFWVEGVRGVKRRGCFYSGGSQTALAGSSPTDPPDDLLRLSGGGRGWKGGGGGAAGVASRLTWRGSGGDKSQFTQGAAALDDTFTGCLHSSFDNAAATSFISLKDESKAANVISSLRRRRHRLRIKQEGGASSLIKVFNPATSGETAHYFPCVRVCVRVGVGVGV